MLLLRPVLLALLLAGAVLATGPALAQRHDFRTYGAGDGLAQGQAFAFLQDREGYLWIGTGGGVSRFDGLAFRNFTVLDGLPNNWVTDLAEDAAGRLWVATEAGIAVLDRAAPEDGAFTAYTTADGLLDGRATALAPDAEGG